METTMFATTVLCCFVLRACGSNRRFSGSITVKVFELGVCVAIQGLGLRAEGFRLWHPLAFSGCVQLLPFSATVLLNIPKQQGQSLHSNYPYIY